MNLFKNVTIFYKHFEHLHYEATFEGLFIFSNLIKNQNPSCLITINEKVELKEGLLSKINLNWALGNVKNICNKIKQTTSPILEKNIKITIGGITRLCKNLLPGGKYLIESLKLLLHFQFSHYLTFFVSIMKGLIIIMKNIVYLYD